MLNDLRYAIRMLRKNPGFTVTALLTLALGIGANTAIFTVVNAALLRPLPYTNPDRLVHLWETSQQQEFGQREASYPDYLDWRNQNHVFDELAGYTSGGLALTGRGSPEQVQVAAVTAGFFSTLGVRMILGRPFLSEEQGHGFVSSEHRQGTLREVILSHRFWQRRFGGDPNLIGQVLTVGGDNYVVTGILPAGFHFSKVGTADLWISLAPSPSDMTKRSLHWINVIARLKPHVSFAQAQAEMDTLARRIAREHLDSHRGVAITVVPLRDEVIGTVKPLLLILLGAVSLVLLIACVNIANLLLVRSAGRQREIAVRIALGASRWQLIRHLMMENILLALLGGGMGLLWAQWGVGLLVAAIPVERINFMPYLQELTIDRVVLSFATGLALITGFLFGLGPAFQASKPDLNRSIKAGKAWSGLGSGGMRDLLVIAEMALALILLVGAGLMMSSLLRLLRVDPGFNPNNLLTLQLSLPEDRYSAAGTKETFHRELLKRVEALPGVKGVATVNVLPLSGGGGTGGILVEGRATLSPGSEPGANLRSVSASYFRTMGIPLIRGRQFTEQDTRDMPRVLIVNQILANRVFPNDNAVGKRIGFNFSKQPWEIIGVVGGENVTSLDSKITPVIYFPYLQDAEPYMKLVVRTASDPMKLLNALQGEIHTLDKDVLVSDIQTMRQLISNSPSTFMRRYPALLFNSFALVALALAMMGIYGVTSYSAGQRTQEIGIRMALGAEAGDILWFFLRRSLGSVALGLTLGLAGAFAFSRVLSTLLYEVAPTDPTTFVGVSLLLGGTAFGATYVPARRATKVDPMVALRYE